MAEEKKPNPSAGRRSAQADDKETPVPSRRSARSEESSKPKKAGEEETTFVPGTGVVEGEDGEMILTDQPPKPEEPEPGTEPAPGTEPFPGTEPPPGTTPVEPPVSEPVPPPVQANTVDGQPNTASPTSSTGGTDVSR